MRQSYKILIVIFTLFLTTITASPIAASELYKSSQFGFMGSSNSYTEIKVGYFDPKAVKEGSLLLGVCTGKKVDESVSFGLEVDFWRKVFEQKIPVDVVTDTNGVETTLMQVQYRHTVYYIPILATLKFDVPVNPSSPITPFAGVSAGYAFAHIGYKFNDDTVAENGVTSSPDKGFYGGWNWRVFGGAAYTLGSNSKLNLAVMYNGAKVSKSEKGGLERELDLKGFGFYASISLIGM